MLRQGEGTPLVLLHGVLGSEKMWRRVIPLVAPHHDAIAPTALGHRGGRPAADGQERIAHVVDDAQRLLDELGIDKAHLAGNSMGGWVALELARRGRALSVCALSSAGIWKASGEAGRGRPAASLRRTMRQARLGRPLLPLLARSPGFRRWAMRLVAAHGDRLTPAEVVELSDDLLGCTIGAGLLSVDGDALAPFAALPCPVTLAWAEKDRVFPPDVFSPIGREILPGARVVILEDMGHVPMLDAPEQVAGLLLEHTGAVSRAA